MDDGDETNEERALGFAGLALIKGIISALETKGLLDGAEIQGVFDVALTHLEYRVQDPAIGLARRIVEGIAISRGETPPEA